MEWDVDAYKNMLTLQVKISADIELALLKDRHLSKAQDVLDIGCGNGCFTAALSDQYPDKQFVGIDVDSELVAFAKTNYCRQNIQYFIESYTNHTGTGYDVIIARLLVHIIPDRMSFFRWVHSKLNGNGTLIIIDADDENFSIYPKPKLLYELDQITNEKIEQIGKRNTKSVVRDELSACNFKEIRFHTISPNSMTVDKALFLRYMHYVMKIELGDQLPLSSYKELFDWFNDDDSFVQYGLYFGLYLKGGQYT